VTTHLIQFSKTLLVDFFGSFLWFPVWWYTTGLKKIVLKAWRALNYRVRSFGLKIWLKNFFVPMYGYHDRASRLISIMMRFFVLIGRLVAVVVIALVYFVGIIAWIAAPPVFLTLGITSGIKGAFFNQIGL